MSTIKDVARLAKVAPSTISNVLNGTKHVSPETEMRIRDAIQALNYSPNFAARSLKRNGSNMIGVLTPNVTNFFFDYILDALDARLIESNYQSIICNFYEDRQRGTDLLQRMVNQGVAGLILIEAAPVIDLSPAIEKNIPMVSVDVRSNVTDHNILVDNYEGGYMATDLLCRKGCRRILHISQSVKAEAYLDRLYGYRNALQSHGLSYDDSLVIESAPKYDQAVQDMNVFLGRNIPFDGVFAASYHLAAGALIALVNAGYRVPEDIKLVGFDDPIDASYTIPPMTSVYQPMREMGTLAAELILSTIEKRPESPQLHILKTTLFERETT